MTTYQKKKLLKQMTQYTWQLFKFTIYNAMVSLCASPNGSIHAVQLK